MTAATKDVVVCAISFTSPAGTVIRGQRLRADDPRVLACPSNFVPDGEREEAWPSALDRVVAENAARAREEEQERGRLHHEAALQNRVKLGATFYRAKRDIECDYRGRPAIVEKGSVVLKGDELLLNFPDDFEKARR